MTPLAAEPQITDLSDGDLTRLCAEKVMGWTGGNSRDSYWTAPGGYLCAFDPLSDWRDAGAVLETARISLTWMSDVLEWRAEGFEPHHSYDHSADPKRAIVLAALRAAGAIE